MGSQKSSLRAEQYTLSHLGRREFDEFNRRAGVVSEENTYQSLVDAIGDACLNSGKPCFILTSKMDVG